MGQKSDWEQPFLNALQSENASKSVAILNAKKSPHRNTPNTAIKSRAVEMIKAFHNFDKRSIWDFASRYVKIGNTTALEISAHLIAFSYLVQPVEATELIRQLADNEDWEVREWTAGACGRILAENFDEFYPKLKIWLHEDSFKIRRAVAVAAKIAAKTKKETYAEPLLDLVEKLLTDGHPYVKNNLGPYAIGDGLLRYYPDKVLDRIDKWVNMESEHARWNVAKIFSAAEGAKHLEKAIEILHCLENDESHVVKRAVKSAKNQLKKRVPELVI
ncbi:DNA alkylation repair protein [Brevibacillus humidisoli]|uniref:DNA alkylation repair protein n=1 Tax=Brevibacillus humidisoli TaxID=2895522 RepID=UPI001E3791C4|nr:DNA alkylation repair protein [Brevibacillus humidisoli]UFJ39419.1 DNA alkylation repair protein [Brevibacillus humidisoli]